MQNAMVGMELNAIGARPSRPPRARGVADGDLSARLGRRLDDDRPFISVAGRHAANSR